jgi:hypothetical protein
MNPNHASHVDIAGSKSSNDREAQANQRNNTGRGPALSKYDQQPLVVFYPKPTLGVLNSRRIPC